MSSNSWRHASISNQGHMIKRSFSIPLVSIFLICLIITNILSFFFFLTTTNETIKSEQSNITVSSIPSNIENSKFIKELQDFTIQTSSNLYLTRGTSENGGYGREIYTIVGNEQLLKQANNSNEFRSFDPHYTVSLHDISELGHKSLDGTYHSTTSITNLRILANNFSRQEIKYSIEDMKNLPPVVFIYSLMQYNLFIFVFILAVSVFFSTAYFLSFRKRYSAILETEGFSKHMILLKWLWQLTRSFALLVVFTNVLTTVFILLYNGGVRLFEYLSVLIFFETLVYIFTILCYFIFFTIMISRIPLLDVIKYQRSHKALKAVSLLCQFLIFLFIFPTMVNGYLNTKTTFENIENLHKYDTISDYNIINTGFGIMLKNAKPDIGNFLRDMDRDQDLVIIHDSSKEMASVLNADQKAYVVNNQYIKTQPILLADGNEFSSTHNLADDKGVVFLLVPDDSTLPNKKLLECANDYFADDLHFLQNSPNVEIIKTKPRQTISNYSNGENVDDAGIFSTIDSDPVILVVPHTDRMLSDSSYSGWLSQQNILISGGVNLEEELTKNGLWKYVTSYAPIRLTLQEELNKSNVALVNYLLSFILAIALIIFITALIVRLYCMQYRQLIFSKYVSGYGFSSIFCALFAQVLTVPLFALIVISWNQFVEVTLPSVVLFFGVLCCSIVSTYIITKLQFRGLRSSAIKQK